MTEEIIRSITDAEEKAAACKRAAEEKAARILSEAEAQAKRAENASEEVCRAYRESQLKAANAQAQTRYEEALELQRKQAKEYCAKALAGADAQVSEIVGRIVSGNR